MRSRARSPETAPQALKESDVSFWSAAADKEPGGRQAGEGEVGMARRIVPATVLPLLYQYRDKAKALFHFRKGRAGERYLERAAVR